ncbi:hypothetical protein BHE74_00027096 [Ensete ventricosum]|nr:hypothetical protein BHE74_00027096 [Ensete ventricosum]RZR75903.1 hypothetical protein BHM03_00000485 [Ensete ventricosum]
MQTFPSTATFYQLVQEPKERDRLKKGIHFKQLQDLVLIVQLGDINCSFPIQILQSAAPREHNDELWGS